MKELPFRLDIGGVRFRVLSHVTIHVEETDPCYEEFLDGDGADPDLTVDVHFCFDDWPDLNAMKKHFDTEASWTLYLSGDKRYLAFRRLEEDSAYLVAELDPARLSVRLWTEMLSASAETTHTVANPLRYPLDQLLLMYALADRRGIILHAAGVILDEKAYVFAGKSGAGKSTIIRSLSACDDITLINDDRVIVREVEGSFRAYGTPWPGEAGVGANVSAELAGLCFLDQAPHNELIPTQASEAAEALMPVATVPWYDNELVPEMLDLCSVLVKRVPTYVLKFKPGEDVAETIRGWSDL